MSPILLGQAKEFLNRIRPSQKGVGVIGDLALDRFIFGSVERISPEAPVPVLWVERREEKLGCAANVVANLSVLAKDWQFPIHVFGVVGVDTAAQDLKGKLQGLGSFLQIHLLEDRNRPTTLKSRYLAGAHHQMLRVDEESQAALSDTQRRELLTSLLKQLPELGVLVIQDYAKGLFDGQLLREIFTRAREKGVFTIVDPHRNTPPEFYKGADLITPNVNEAEILSELPLKKGSEDSIVTQAAKKIQVKLDVKHCLITRSAHGMTLVEQSEQVSHLPSVARAVFDVTGAGDTVVAVLAASQLMGASLVLSAYLASAAAGVVVAKVGTATADMEEIQQELKHLG